MREINCCDIAKAVEKLCIEANCLLPEDVKDAISSAEKQEESTVGRSILGDLIENYKFAGDRMLPICQDTGMAVVFCDIGQDAHITGGLLSEAVDEGVRRGYVGGFLRCSVVKDPLRRINTDDNTPAVLHIRIVSGDRLHITVAPKGFGSENMSVLKMFNPSSAVNMIEDFIVKAVSDAGSNPCPPIILGVGLGGTSEQAMLLAKRALLRPLSQKNPDEFYSELEGRILEKINRLGIGPQGLGGTVTALGVNIITTPTHIAGLPCALNFGCHATRHACAVL